ncbi:puromycin-sensitive aminopeptidase-like [Haliotis cracherodii]|uniref:puromycin-sensitive aminopeptidase-like n=1 Tax=Haliotis cracherodii TaxID=6455 RepID=UPI0039EA1481
MQSVSGGPRLLWSSLRRVAVIFREGLEPNRRLHFVYRQTRSERQHFRVVKTSTALHLLHTCRLATFLTPKLVRSVSTLLARNFSTMPEKREFKRLPTDVVPSNYNIRLKPDLDAFVFQGQEEIDVEVKTSTDTVTVNSLDITINEVTYASGDKSLAAEVSVDKEEETATFKFPSPLQPGKGVLKVSYTGELNDKMKGFYRSKYTMPDGQERFGAVTQFEATDARRAFPGWDEPAVKASFDVTLVVPKEKVALSNMPVKSDTPDKDPNWRVVEYDRTPVMSTYLLAFIVGDYDYVEGKDADGVIVRVYTPMGKKEQGNFALDVAVKTLPFYKDYFGIPYPLPKMDLIAIADFASGAMENWGLVTYRETALLVDPANTSARVKQWVALVVGHELAHQWFGNLVTMEWWTNLWLNEGFASWIEYLCVDECFPEYDIWTQFVNMDLGRALELDALHTSHPIEVPVGHPAEVDEIFDAISYSKGASVIRMLHDYLGDEDFRKGMNKYLTQHQYKNTVTEDLWASLGEASGKPVAKMMDTWTKQMGFPVIKVSERQDGDKRILTISQEKFCADGKLPAEDKSSWLVPISFSTAGSPSTPVKTIMLEGQSSEVTLDNVKAGEWVKVNTNTVGVYRVQYTTEMLAALIPAVKDRSLPPRDRLGLQNDLFALARAGMAASEDVLKVAEAFINEDNYTVWNDLALNLSSMAVLLQYTDCYDLYKAFARDLFSQVAQTVGWDKKEGESQLTAMLRDLILTKMGRYGDEPTVAEARKRFESHYKGDNVISPDLRAPVFITVLSQGKSEDFDKMLELYDKADMQEEKSRIGRALGAVKDEELIKRVHEFAMTDKVRAQDTVFVLAGATGSAKGRELTWNFVKENWKEMYERYHSFLLARLVKSSTENFATEEMAQAVEEFFKANPAPAAERTVQQSLENIRLNARWMKESADKVCQFLKSRK